jgi:hypothetical protein
VTGVRLIWARIIAVLIGGLMTVLIAAAILRFLPVTSGLAYLPVDEANPVIRFRPDRAFVFSRGWKLALANRGRTNNYGFVNDQDYDPRPSSPLMAVIGDSYVEALMVPYRDTVHGRLAEVVRGCGRVYSFAVSASPLSQYLVFAEYARTTFRPMAMAIVVIPNDFDESLLNYQRMPGLYGFHESPGGELSLARVDYRPGLARALVMASALARYLDLHLDLRGVLRRVAARVGTSRPPRWVGNTVADADPGRVSNSMNAVQAFLTDLPERSGLPASRIVFLVDGLRPELYAPDTLAVTVGTYPDVMRRHFIAAAQERGHEVVDMQATFMEHYARVGRRFEAPEDGHWNGLGHEVAAAAIGASAAFARTFGAPPCRASSSLPARPRR